MEKNEILWKKAEQSFVSVYDFAHDVLDGKIVLSASERTRLLGLLDLWIEALEKMSERASDVEMARDFSSYLGNLQSVKQRFEQKFL